MKAFTSISLLIPVAERFRNFSREKGNSHSEILTQMMDFFQENKLSPADSLAGSLQERDQQVNKRLNTIIAILRDIEQTQTQPALAILESLMLKVPSSPNPNPPSPPARKTELPIPESSPILDPNTTLVSKSQEILRELQYVLDRVKPENNWLGQQSLVLDIPREEFERLKIKIKRL